MNTRLSISLPRLAVVCLFTLGGVALAQDNLQSSFDELLTTGAEQLEAEEFEAANESFTQAIALSSFDPRGYIGRGKALIGLQQYDAALKDFKLAEDRSPNAPLPELLHARGELYLQYGPQGYGVAISDLQAAYEADRENLEYVLSLGKAYSLIANQTPGAGAQAVELLTKYLESNPDSAEALRYRAQALIALNKADEALADVNRSIEIDPEGHENYFSLGLIYYQLKDYEKSAAALDEAIAHYQPASEDDEMPYGQAYLIKAGVLEEAGKKSDDPEQAKQYYQQQVETCNELLTALPDTPQAASMKLQAYFRKGIGERLQGKLGDAVKSLTEAIDLNPEMGEAYYRRAICFTYMQEEELALGDLEAAQALNFEDPRAYLWQGLTHAQAGDYRDAIRAYNEAISFSNRYVDAYLNRAHAYFQLGEYQSAIDSFTECIRLQPQVASHHYKRGICYKQLDEVDKEVRAYINAIQFDEKFLPAYDALIPALEAQGRRDLAAQYRDKRSQVAESLSSR